VQEIHTYKTDALLWNFAYCSQDVTVTVDERNRKVRGFIAILGEGDRPTFDCRKKGKQGYVRIGGIDSYLKCLHHR